MHYDLCAISLVHAAGCLLLSYGTHLRSLVQTEDWSHLDVHGTRDGMCSLILESGATLEMMWK